MSGRIKILNVLTIIEDGGMETLVSRIYKGLKDKGEFDFYICSLRPFEKSYLLDYYRSSCKDVVSFNMVNKELKAKDYAAMVSSCFKLASYIKSNRIDIVHFHDFFSAFITRLALVISQVMFFYRPKKRYLTLHNTLNWLGKKHNMVNRALAAVTDKIICVSKSVYEYSRQTDKVSEKKYTVIYNGIDTELFRKYEGEYEKLRGELGFKPSDFVIGNISTFSVRKGHIYLLKAFKELLSKFPDAKLLFVGSQRSHEQEIASEIFAFINNNNLNNYVKILDTRQDIFRIYNALDLYIMPSIVEGYGLALAEAMSSELLCIGSDIPAFKELLKDSQNGFLFKNKDEKALHECAAAVISAVKNEPSKMEEIRLNARNTIVRGFSQDKMLDGYYKLYNI